MGITGVRDTVAQITKDTIKRIKQKTNGILPILVGFGISQPQHAKTIVEAGADGVIIGSAIVNIIKANLNDYLKMEAEIVEFASSIKNAIKR
jgi:tryptophan synthase alpha chain